MVSLVIFCSTIDFSIPCASSWGTNLQFHHLRCVKSLQLHREIAMQMIFDSLRHRWYTVHLGQFIRVERLTEPFFLKCYHPHWSYSGQEYLDNNWTIATLTKPPAYLSSLGVSCLTSIVTLARIKANRNQTWGLVCIWENITRWLTQLFKLTSNMKVAQLILCCQIFLKLISGHLQGPLSTIASIGSLCWYCCRSRLLAASCTGSPRWWWGASKSRQGRMHPTFSVSLPIHSPTTL